MLNADVFTLSLALTEVTDDAAIVVTYNNTLPELFVNATCCILPEEPTAMLVAALTASTRPEA
jgi:hypothetical protein